MNHIYIMLIFCCLFVVQLFIGCAQQQPQADTIVPESIPAGYDFPANREAIQSLVNNNNINAMRKHGWNIWAGLTADSKSTFQGNILPIWETWLATADVFTDPPTEHSGELKTPARMFTQPSQFIHTGLTDSAEQNLIVGFNKFNPAMVGYLFAGHQGPGNQKYYYTDLTSMGTLNSNWPAGTPIAIRKIQDAPPRAIELKPVLMLVKANKITAIPFWQGPDASTDKDCKNISIKDLLSPRGKPATDCHPSPDTWLNSVLINPKDASTNSLVPATQSQFSEADLSQTPGCTNVENALYGSLNMIYHFEMNANEAADFNNNQHPTINAEAGDFAVLVAMHVNTKEIIEWTWQTFWWQGGQNPPENFPGRLDDMTGNVKGVWRNYAMCTSYSQTIQSNNQGQMRVCFNPFLETSTGIPDGIRSNCVSCHGAARVSAPTKGAYPLSYGEPVDFGGKQYFADSTKTDFSWAIPFNSH